MSGTTGAASFGAPPPTTASTTAPPGEAAIAATIESVRVRVQELIDRASPDADFLRKLGDGLLSAERSGRQPALVDPDRFWSESLWPRAGELGAKAEAMLNEAMHEVRNQVAGVEADLVGWARQQAWEASANDDAPTRRPAAIDHVAERLEALHVTVAAFAEAAPSPRVVERTTDVLAEHRRRAAHDAVRRERRDYLASAGVDPQAQRLAELQWEAMAPERVDLHDAALRARLPWRHQELALHAMAQTIDRLRARCEAMAEQLTIGRAHV